MTINGLFLYFWLLFLISGRSYFNFSSWKTQLRRSEPGWNCWAKLLFKLKLRNKLQTNIKYIIPNKNYSIYNSLTRIRVILKYVTIKYFYICQGICCSLIRSNTNDLDGSCYISHISYYFNIQYFEILSEGKTYLNNDFYS